jgi:hypothetical protein
MRLPRRRCRLRGPDGRSHAVCVYVIISKVCDVAPQARQLCQLPGSGWFLACISVCARPRLTDSCCVVSLSLYAHVRCLNVRLQATSRQPWSTQC